MNINKTRQVKMETIDKKKIIKQLKEKKQENDKKQYYINNFDDKFPNFEKIYHYFDIVTTRFKSNTYNELIRYKENHDLYNISLYGVGYPMTSQISQNKCLLVLEMNNTINKIMGIGLLKNVLAKNQDVSIYSNETYNEYIYKSNFHIRLRQIGDIKNVDVKGNLRGHEFEDYVPEDIIQLIECELEPLCFKGKGHQKRGGSFSRFPTKWMNLEMFKKIINLFIMINPNNFNEIIYSKFA